MMRIEHLQMETTASIRRSIPPGTWTVSIDLMDAYLHIPIHPASRKFLRLSLEGTVYQFRALPFTISTAPVYKPDGYCGRTYLISGAQHSPVLRRLAYPSSVPGVSPVQPVTVMGNHYKPRSNTKSSEIRPSSFSGLQFLGMRFPTHLGIVRVPEESQKKFFTCFSGFCRFSSLPPENFCPCWDHSLQQQI